MKNNHLFFLIVGLLAARVISANTLENAINKHDVDCVETYLHSNALSNADKTRYLDLCEHAIKKTDEDFLIYRMKNYSYPSSDLLLAGGAMSTLLSGIFACCEQEYRKSLSIICLLSIAATMKGYKLSKQYRMHDTQILQRCCDDALAIKQLIYQA